MGNPAEETNCHLNERDTITVIGPVHSRFEPPVRPVIFAASGRPHQGTTPTAATERRVFSTTTTMTRHDACAMN
jgi:hypothetical protein